MNSDADAALIEECERRSLTLVCKNLERHGVLAARPSDSTTARGDDCVLGRDGALCAIAAAPNGDRAGVRGARCTRAALAAPQAAKGQNSECVVPGAQRGHFRSLNCIDVTLRRLIALKLVGQVRGGRREHRLKSRMPHVVASLACQEHPPIHRLQQKEASDSADIMLRRGFALCTKAFWPCVKEHYMLPGDGDPLQYATRLIIRQPPARLAPPAPADSLRAATQSRSGSVPELPRPVLLGRTGPCAGQKDGTPNESLGLGRQQCDKGRLGQIMAF